MKAHRLFLLCLLSLGGIATSADAHEPRISIQFGYPVYVEPPPVYYAPPPPVYFESAPVYYAPRVERRVIVVPDEDDGPRYYRHDNGRHRGWYKHRHHDHDD